MANTTPQPKVASGSISTTTIFPSISGVYSANPTHIVTPSSINLGGVIGSQADSDFQDRISSLASRLGVQKSDGGYDVVELMEAIADKMDLVDPVDVNPFEIVIQRMWRGLKRALFGSPKPLRSK